MDRDLLRAQWLLGWVRIQQASQNSEQREPYLEEAHHHLQDALDRCKRTSMVDYEADLLLAWARWHTVQENERSALVFANEALTIANRSGFRLLQADIHLVFAHNLLLKHVDEAEKHAQKALEAATCDGSSYRYMPAFLQAQTILSPIQTIQEKGHNK